MPAEPATNDTGLHVAMRLLLGIVAGLLVSDILKAFVETIVGDKQSCCPALGDSIIVFGAMLFIVRVVVDNVLHYHEVDPITGTGVYATRVRLIVLDLMSYTLCYATVALLAPKDSTLLPKISLFFAALALTAVEFLHWTWCRLAIVGLNATETEYREEPIRRLEDWRDLSGRSALVGVVATALTAVAVFGINAAWTKLVVGLLFFAYTVWSAVSYVRGRSAEYLRRRPK